MLNAGENKIAIKRLKSNEFVSDEIQKRELLREGCMNAKLWKGTAQFQLDDNTPANYNYAIPAYVDNGRIPIILSKLENKGCADKFIEEYVRELPKNITDRSLAIDIGHMLGKLVKDTWVGMNQIHHLGIMHGDLWCNNILVDKISEGKYVAKIADFGLSSEFDPKNQDSKIFIKHKMQEPRMDYNRRANDLLSCETDLFSYKICILEMLLKAAGSSITPLLKELQDSKFMPHDATDNPNNSILKHLYAQSMKYIEESNKTIYTKEILLGSLNLMNDVIGWGDMNLTPSQQIENTKMAFEKAMDDISKFMEKTEQQYKQEDKSMFAKEETIPADIYTDTQETDEEESLTCDTTDLYGVTKSVEGLGLGLLSRRSSIKSSNSKTIDTLTSLSLSRSSSFDEMTKTPSLSKAQSYDEEVKLTDDGEPADIRSFDPGRNGSFDQGRNGYIPEFFKSKSNAASERMLSSNRSSSFTSQYSQYSSDSYKVCPPFNSPTTLRRNTISGPAKTVLSRNSRPALAHVKSRFNQFAMVFSSPMLSSLFMTEQDEFEKLGFIKARK